MIRLRFAFLAAAAALLPLALAAPTQASAAPAPAASAAPAATTAVNNHGCPATWFCFYSDASFRGRMLKYQDCGLQNFPLDFNDQTTSWINRTGSTIVVYRDADGKGPILWRERPHKRFPNVGAAKNDKASSFRRLC